MSWHHFHKNEAVTYDDNICNFGRVFYHDTTTDMIQIVVRTEPGSVKGWTIIRRPAKDVRRTIPIAHRWTLEDVFNTPKQVKPLNTSPVPEPNDYMSRGTIDSFTVLHEDIPNTKLNMRDQGMLSKLFDMLRFT